MASRSSNNQINLLRVQTRAAFTEQLLECAWKWGMQDFLTEFETAQISTCSRAWSKSIIQRQKLSASARAILPCPQDAKAKNKDWINRISTPSLKQLVLIVDVPTQEDLVIRTNWFLERCGQKLQSLSFRFRFDAKTTFRLPDQSIERFYTMHDAFGDVLVTVASINWCCAPTALAQKYAHLFQPKRLMVVMGLSNLVAASESAEKEAILKHHRELRRVPCVGNGALSINLAEANMGSTSAARIYSYVSQPEFQPTFRVNQTLGKCGVSTCQQIEKDGVGMLLRELTEGNMVFASQIASNAPDRLDATKIELIDQIKRVGPRLIDKVIRRRVHLVNQLGILLYWISQLQKQEEYQNTF